MSRALSSRLGLYIHFPFCAYKCGYCDFNSWVEKDSEPQHRWLEGLKNEVRYWNAQQNNALSKMTVDTLFMGGGTPSLLKEDLWDDLSAFLKQEFHFSEQLEWSVEANPETIKENLLDKLDSIGVNRLSLGIQSFKEKFLKRLERGATPESNKRALSLINKYWKNRWSLDLMFGLPEQTAIEWQEDLSEALSFGMKHLSAYQLTLTTEKSKKWLQGTDAELLDFFHYTREHLKSAGLESYEISNFAKKGEECRHNLKYWRAESFLGLGPGAYSLIPNQLLDNQDWGAHLKTPSRFDDWFKWTMDPKPQLESRSEKTHVTELLLLGLRLENGIEKSYFPEGVDWSKLSEIKHLIEEQGDRLIATPRGRDILDTSILEAVRALYPN